MTYTTEQALQMAQEVGAVMIKDGHSMAPTFTVGLTYKKLTALCNAVQKQTLLEAAEVAKGIDGERFVSRELRRMAGVE